MDLKTWKPGQPRLERSLTLHFTGDWGQANFHRIASWLCQEACDRMGPKSRVAIWNLEYGGIDSMISVFEGATDLGIVTPAGALPASIEGTGIFEGRPMPNLRALAVLPQNDKMVFAIDPKFGCSTFAELREKKPPLRIATSIDDGFNLIGYTARRFMEAHGVDEETLRSWGGEFVYSARPEQSVFRMRDGDVDAVVQEAIMIPAWREAVAQREAVVFAAEEEALARLKQRYGWTRNDLPANYLPGQTEPKAALDFADFVIVVRDDMPEDLAHLLTWCLVETRGTIERAYKHLPQDYSPLGWPMDPAKMARPSLPLHPGARRYFIESGILPADS